MSLPKHILFGVGGTLTVDLNERPTNAIATILTGDGTSRGSITGTVSTINTIINVAATKGSTELSVNSNTGMSVGAKARFLDDPEDVLIRKASGCNISLRRPLMVDHVNAANIVGTSVEFSINSAVANVLFWDGHAEVNIDGGSSFVHFAVECTKYPMASLCSVQDIADVEPNIYHMLSDTDDLERLKDMAVQHVLGRIATAAPDLRARVYPGSVEFSHATALAAMMYVYGRQHGDEAKEMYERYRDRLENEINRVAQTTPRDTDQDGVIEASERISPRGGRLVF